MSIPAVQNGKPLIVRGSLLIWERKQRARMAAEEEAGEMARLKRDLDAGRTARDALIGVYRSIGFRLMRRLGYWGSLERSIRRIIGGA